MDAVRVGDRLIQVDDLQLKNATRCAILVALHGNPGEFERLLWNEMANA